MLCIQHRQSSGQVWFALLLFFVTSWQPVFSQESFRLKSCVKKQVLAPKCSISYQWFEPIGASKTVNEQVGNMIRKQMSQYFLEPDAASEYCSGQMEYNAEMEIMYRKQNMLSCFFTSFEYYQGTPHGYRKFSTANYNMQTGKSIELYEFLDSTRMVALHFDSLMYQRLSQSIGVTDVFELKPYLENGLALSYVITDNKLIIYLRGQTYADSMLEITWMIEELENFITPQTPAFLWKNAHGK